MTPLHVVAHVPGQIALPHGPLALDALLAAQVALELQLPPPRHAADCVPIDIPIEKEPGGRFHLCSFSEHAFEEHDVRWVNRRAPVEQYQTIGTARIRRVRINAGVNKSYRLPLETGLLVDGRLDWWCIGAPEEMRRLLALVSYIGKKRSVGLGRVARWEVEPCEPWGDGFPVMREGMPLRTLPLDWPGLAPDAPRAEKTLTYPYWAHELEEVCACPL